MLRLRINELLQRVNADRQNHEKIHMKDVAESLGVGRTTLSNMTTFNGERATNTAILEALIRFFDHRLPQFDIRELFEFRPPLGEPTEERVDLLYPDRAFRNRPRPPAG